MTAGASTVHAYTITVSNAGPSEANSVSLSDTWPTGFTRGTVTPSQGSCSGSPSFNCSLGTIVSGGSATVTVSYTVPSSTTDDQTNTATVSSATSDPNPVNNSASDTDSIAPVVQSINRAGTNPTNASSVDWTVKFSKNVTGVDAGDFALVNGGLGGSPAITNVTGSGDTYTVTASTGTGSGTLGLNLVDNDSIQDGAGNRLGGTGAGNGNFTGQVYTIDRTAPSVTINQAATQSDPATTAPIHFTAVFSEPVTGFNNTGVTLSGCSGATSNVYDMNQATPDHMTYDIRVNNLPNTSCTVVASITANKAQDAAGNGNVASTSTDNSVTWQPTAGNTAPVVTVDSPAFGSVYAKGSASINPLTVKAHFSDPDNSTSWTYTINWDDNNAVSTGSATPYPSYFSGTHQYTAAGVYTINVCAKDNQGASGCAQVWIVVYDPAAGFITGGGWINVNPGSYTADPTLSGRANFGFNSQYKKGATVPTGETEFNFQVGNFDFHSDAYNWLVVSGFKAQYKGTGTVNGVSGYDFTLTAYDGDITGGGGVDKFRIRITKTNGGNVVFDNRNGLPTDMDTADPEAISGGSIVIHKA